MSAEWRAYARHILDCAAVLERIQARGDITGDDILYDAALRNLHTLAEATQRLPDSIKDRYPHIEWRKISAFRNIIVHNYLGDIDPVTVTKILQEHVAPLTEAMTNALKDHL